MARISVYSTCPSSTEGDPAAFAGRVREVARWSDEHEITGLLVYTDNTLIDPWLTGQLIIEASRRCVPLVAVQPVYMHPFAAARAVASLGVLYGRAVHLNLVTGGFAGHLKALHDELDHDQRYRRLGEYAAIVRQLLTSPRPTTFVGEFYRLEKALLAQRLDPGLLPRMFLSGSSAACVQTAGELGVTRLSYCGPPSEYVSAAGDRLRETGIRIGIIARSTSADAWKEAESRFPFDRIGEQLYDMAARSAESFWHHEMSERADGELRLDSVYWLYPFRTYKTFCPYLVGSYREVTAVMERYFALGVSTIILDTPMVADDFRHARLCIDAAQVSA